MGYDIGPRIGIDGEKEFRKSINDINTTMRTLDTEMKMVASQFDASEKSQEKYTEENKVLNKQIELQKTKLSELSKGLEMAADKYGESDAKTQRWQQSVNKAKTDLNKLERNLKNNTDALDDFGDELDDAAKKGGKFKGAMGGIKDGLGAIGGGIGKAAIGSITAVTGAVAAAVTGTVALTEATREYREDLSKLEQNAKDSGNSFDLMKDKLSTLTALTGETDSAVEALSNLMASGIDDNGMTDVIDSLSGAIIKFPDTLKIESLADGLQETLATGAATGAFGELIERLGYNIDDFNLKLADCTTEAEKQQVAMDFLANSGLKEVSDQYKETNAAAIEAAEAQFDLNDTLAEVGEIAEPVISMFKKDFVNVLKDVVGIMKGTDGATDSFKSNIKSLAQNTVSTINSLLPSLIEGLKSLLPALVQGVADMAPDILLAALSMMTLFAESIIGVMPDLLPVLITAVISFIMMFAQLFIDQGPMLIELGMSTLMMLIDGIIEALPLLIEMTIVLMLAFVTAFLGQLPELIPLAIELITTLAYGLIDALPILIEMAPEIVRALVTTLIENLPLLVDATVQIIVALVTTIVENLPMIFDAAVEIILQLIAGLMSMVGEVLGFVPTLYDSFVEKFENMDWQQLGKDIIAGIVNGVSNAAGNLAQSAKDAADNALSAVKTSLGIQSPSRVFRDEVGAQISAGMAEGIKQSSYKVDSALKQVNDGMVSGVKVGTTGNGSDGGDTIVNVNVPLTLDGKKIASKTSKIQVKNNRKKSRSLGVVPI